MATLTIDKTKKWTVDDYQQLEEDVRCEVIGEELIMTPAPNTQHQKVLLALLSQFIKYLDLHNEGQLLPAPTDVYFDKKNVYQPDVIFIAHQNLSIVKEKGIEGTPDLIIEIISPSNSFVDRYVKKNKYEEFGVKEYWIADPANKTLEIFSLNKERHYEMFLFLSEEGTVKSKVLEKMDFDLKEVFGL